MTNNHGLILSYEYFMFIQSYDASFETNHT